MGVSLSGLVSNMDTDSIVSALVSGYKTKKDGYVKEQTRLEWKQDAWKGLNTKIYDFYSKTLSPMRFSSAFNKKASSASSTKATINASSSAVSGTQKLKINSLATSGYLTGGVVKKTTDSSKSTVTGSTKLADIGVEDGSVINVTVNGKEKSLTIDGNTTVNTFVTKLKDMGLNASYDEKNSRLFVSAKTSGTAGDFSLTAGNEKGTAALSSLGLNSVSKADIEQYVAFGALSDEELAAIVEKDYTKQKTSLYDFTDEATVKKLKDALTSTNTKLANQNITLENTNKYLGYKKDSADSYESEYNILTDDEKTAFMSNLDSQIKELSKNSEPTDEEKDQLLSLKAKMETYKDLSKDGIDITEYSNEISNTIVTNAEKIADNTSKIETNTQLVEDETDDGVFKTYVDGLNNDINIKNNELLYNLTEFYYNKRETAQKYVNAYKIVNATVPDDKLEDYKNSDAYKDAAALLGMSGGTTGATRIEGKDAQIELNGALFTSNSNNFQINGLTINVNAVTEPDEEITVTTDTDTKGIYDMVKNFFKEYNTLINEMDSLYNANSAKGYEPLTDEEKEAMSDKDVEKWEEKIKDALFRRDQTLDSVSNTLKNSFIGAFEIDGKKYSLASFGIKTASYFMSADNEKSAYHIDGDSDDKLSSGTSDKLMAAIGSDPEGVAEFFNKLATNIYSNLDKKMKSTTLKSAYTVYNDKQMKTEYNEYSKTIKTWEKKIEEYEERYRKQFTAMEKAMSQLNSQQSQLSGLLGM